MTEERKSENALRKPRVDVVIPTYKPGKKFSRLLKMLEKQTYPIGKIIVMNTEKAFWNEKGFEGISNLQVHHLIKAEFDHGATRNRGMRFSRADIVVFMTDDAVPADEFLIEKLVGAFDQRGPEGEAVIMAYARQLPDKDCPLAERYTRSFNYPEESCLKTKADLKRLGIKTFFASNVCCAYDREKFWFQGGFIKNAIFNEDMIFAGNSSIFLMIDIDDPIVFLLLEDRIFLLSFQIDVPFLKDILDDRLKIGLLRKVVSYFQVQ